MNKKCLFQRSAAVFCSAVILFGAVIQPAIAAEADGTGSSGSSSLVGASTYSYFNYLQDIETNGYQPYTGEALTFGLDALIPADGVAPAFKEIDGIQAALSDEEHPKLTFQINVATSGLYQMGSKYIFNGGTGLNGTRKLLIDGESIYLESDNIPFYRKFTDSAKPKTNKVGDEVKAPAKEIVEWQESDFYDNMGKYSNPLTFYLEAGQHTITLEYDEQPLAIAYLTLSAPAEHPSYSEYITAKNESTSGFSQRFQAEDAMTYRNDSSLGASSDGDPKVTPSKPGYLRMNTVGGNSFRKGGQAITFEVTVDRAGYYCINFRSKQSWAGKLNSHKKIEINHEVPFEELECVAFPYDTKWQNVILGGKENPYQIYLKEGKNEITVTTVLGPNTETLVILEDALNKLSSLIRKITMIIGSEPDLNYDYELESTIPGLQDSLQEIADLLTQARERCNAQNNGKDTVMGNNLESVITPLLEMKEDTESIPQRNSELSTMVTSIGDYITTLQDQAVQFDYIEVFSPDVEIKDYHSSFIDNLISTIQGFIVSFSKDYNAISSGEEGESTTILDVWIGRGREWAEILKQVADADFTAKNGIELNLNIVPSGQLAASGTVNLLMLAISAGTQPDVAMGIPSNMPVEYAIRNAAVDISGMDGYEEMISHFPEQLMVPFEYEGGVYGVPETMYFRGMFYRTDIMEELGLKVPETWDEVFNDLIPALYENGMQFNIPNWLDTFLLTNGGSYYKTDENGHVQSALDTPEAYEAFKMLTDAYVVYGVPTSANFLNRFRTGEMPIGLEGSPLYLQLIAAAPELNGRWAMAQVPGIRKEDGTVERHFAGYVGEAVTILSGSEKVPEAFEFMKWWTSTETQTTYGREVESRIGSYARWLTSNMDAFKVLPWDKDDLKTIVASWDNLIEIPNVLGGYYTSRHLTNAWNRVVVNGMSARESLEQCVIDINKELDRRREQLEDKNSK